MRAFLARVVAFSVAFAPVAHANPTGPGVAAGSASFAAQGNTLNVTNTPGTIINWQGFSIGANEITRFLQSGASSAVLNRVTGGTASQILGQLLSNGRVFLVNPNGILVGAGATIDTAGFVASTLNLTDADFISGRLRFAGGPADGRIANQGTIRGNGGAVYLIAPNIENSGLITSAAGEIVLAAGRSVELVDAGTPAVRVRITAPEGADLNLSAAAASGAAGAFGVLSNTGSVNASGVSVEGGRIVLHAEKDAMLAAGSRIGATGTKGGSVQVLGERVALTGDARIDVSGTGGGGSVLVGGDFQGANPAITNAWRTYLGSDAVINADAVVAGNGGRVIVWADDATRAYGTISARGGAQSGNGGFVEVSGKGWLDYQARASIGAANGKGGTLLLDPTDITIVGSGGTLDAELSGTADPDLLFADGGANTTLTLAKLTTGFTSGDTIRLQATNDINFNQAVSLSPGVNLEAKANNNINLNSNIISAGGTWSLTPDADSSGAGKVNFGSMQVATPLTVNGNATFATGTLGVNGSVVITGGFDWSGGTISGGSSFTVTGSTTLSGTPTLASQAISFNSASTVVPGGTLSLSSGVINGTGSLSNQGTIAARGTNAINVGFSNAAGATLRLEDTNGSPGSINLTVANGFTNNGLIELVNNVGNCCGPTAATLAVTTGTLTNAVGATLRSTGLTTASNVIDANVTNLGTVEVQAPTIVSNSGKVFDSTAGTFNIGSGQKLDVQGGTLSLGAGTAFAGSGSLRTSAAAVIDLASNLTLAGAGGVTLDLNGTGATTVTSATPGTQLIVPAGGSLALYNDTLGANVDLANSGTVTVAGISPVINGGLVNAAGATLRLSDTAIPPGTITFTVANGFTNSGLIELVNNSGNCCGPRAAELIVSTGTLTNAAGATIRSTGTNAVTNFINGQLTNLGTIDVQQPMQITNAGKTFTSTAGTINVAAGQKLTVLDGTMSLGAGTAFSGSGSLATSGSAVIDLASNLTLAGAGGVTLDLNGTGATTVTSATPGTQLIVPAGGSLALYNDTIGANVDLDNSGTVTVGGISPAINGGLVNAAGATLRLSDTAIPPGSINLTVANGFTNNGLIELVNNSGNCCGARAAELIVSTGTLTNAAGATIRSTGANAATNLITGQVANLGTIDVQRDLTVTSLASNDGTISFSANSPTLTLNNGALANTAAGVIEGSGTLNLGAGTLANAGTIRPGGAITRGLLSVTGNVDFTGGTLDLDVAGVTTPGTDYDSLSITGAATLAGTVNLIERAGFTTKFTDAITPVLYGSLAPATTFGTINTTVTSGTAAFGQTNNATNTVFALTSGVTNYTATGLTNWNVGSNWDRGTPTSTTDAFITLGGANTVTVNTNEAAKSLSISANNTLTVTNSVVLNVANAVTNNGTVRVDSGASSSPTTMTVGNGFANNGMLELLTNPGSGGGTGAGILNVTTGTLANAIGATIRSAGTGTTPTDNLLNAAVTNLGTMDVQRGLSITNAARTFTSTAGTLNIAAGQRLSVNGGITSVGSGTVLTGSGTLTVAGPTLDLASDFTLAGAGGVTLDLNGTGGVTVNSATPGTNLVVPATGALSFSGDTIAANVNLVNSGTVTVTGPGAANTVTGALTNNTGATLRIDSGANSTPTTLTVANGFTNNGLVELLTNPGSGGGTGVGILNITTGTLTNAAGATIRSAGTGTTPADNTLDTVLTNLGTMDVQRGLSITNAARTFTSTAGTLNVAAGQKLTVNGGITSLGSGTAFTGSGTLTVAGPTLDLASNLTLAGAGGVTLDLNGTGGVTVNSATPGTNLVVPATGALAFSGDTIAANVNLVNSGTVTVTGPGGTHTMDGGLTNNVGATLRIDSGASSAPTALTVANGFTNNGLIELLTNPGSGGGTGVGILNVTAGTLTNAAGATLRSAGTGTTPNNNVLNGQAANLGTIDLQRGLTITNLPTNDGTISFSANNPTLTLSNAALANTAAGVIQGVGTLDVGAGTLANAGTIRPGGAVTRGLLSVTGNVDFTGGTLDLDVAGATTPGTDYDSLSISGTATLAGTVNVIEQAGFTTKFTDFVTPVVYGSRTVASTFGTINTTTSAGVAAFDATYNPTNAVFLLATGQSTYTGTGATGWGVAANWDRGTPTASVDAIISTAGTNTITLNTTEAVKSLVLTGTNTLAITGGVLDIGAPSSVAAGATLSLSGGTLQGIGAVAVDGTFNWSGGTLAGAGTTAIAAGGVLAISGAAAKVLDSRTLTNNSVAGSTWAGTGDITRVGGADGAFVNAGLLDIQGDASFTHGAFVNSGTLVKSAGAGLTQFNASTGTFTNTGTVNANAGTLRLFNAPTNAGTLDIAAGATISTGNLASGGIIKGNGTLDLNGGTLTNAGMVAPGTSPGTLTIIGNYTQTPAGTLAVELGGTTAGTGFDVLAVTGNAALDGTLAVTNFGGFLPAAADVFRFLTVGGARTGTFATTTLPAGYTGGATYGATFADLALSAGVVVVPPPPPALPGALIVTVAPGLAETPTATETNTRSVVASLDRMIDVIVGAPAKKRADDETSDASVLMCK